MKISRNRIKVTLSTLICLAVFGSPAGAQTKRLKGHPPPPVVVPPAVAPSTPPSVWQPTGKLSWQWQLTTPVDLSVNAAVYDIDGFDNDASVVAALHSAGRKAVCYVDFGTWEDWRPDAGLFPSSVKGSSNGWPGEVWLDIRQLAILSPILSTRLDMCKAKGFDAVEPDNIDGYSNSTGFPLSAQDQVAFNSWIADAAHARGLSIGLKNDVDQVPDLVTKFDWALDEQCFQYGECSTLTPFVAAGKAVFEVEYSGATSSFCPSAAALGFNSIKKRLALDSWLQPCP